jgi:DnaJ-class molecular chaperone
MKQGEHVWCDTCDGEGMVGVTVTLTCPDCGGVGCISKRQIESDIAAAAKLQATVDETSKRIAGDTK